MRQFSFTASLLFAIFTSGCSGLPSRTQLETGGGNVPVLVSASVTENRTPVDDALVCYGDALLQARRGVAPLSVAVGDVRDFTGRLSDQEGATITQGAALMVYSSLASIGSAIRIHERLDPRVAELELGYMDRQRLGDGQMHRASPTSPPAPWVPYMGGSILQSDYYIVGGVTELNNSLATGGVEAVIGGIGGRARYAVINVAVDLRIVNTRNLLVEHAVSMQKQIIGQEIGIDVFRFFETRLFDVKGGQQLTEPVQLAVRSVLQLATLDLLEAISGVSNELCIRKVQPDLERTLPKPKPFSQRVQWPPDPKTAVSTISTSVVSQAALQQKTPFVLEKPLSSTDQLPLLSPEQQVSEVQPIVESGASVIGAATSAEAAKAQWERMRKQNDTLLSSVEADLVSVGRPDGPFLIVVEDKDKSPIQFCEAARASGLECEVAPPQVVEARAIARKASRAP